MATTSDDRSAKTPLRALFLDGAHEQVVAVSHQAARGGRFEPLPDALHPQVRTALAVQGVERLYSHQRRTYELLEAGHKRGRGHRHGKWQVALLRACQRSTPAPRTPPPARSTSTRPRRWPRTRHAS